jgi:hypothetical protein
MTGEFWTPGIQPILIAYLTGRKILAKFCGVRLGTAYFDTMRVD